MRILRQENRIVGLQQARAPKNKLPKNSRPGKIITAQDVFFFIRICSLFLYVHVAGECKTNNAASVAFAKNKNIARLDTCNPRSSKRKLTIVVVSTLEKSDLINVAPTEVIN